MNTDEAILAELRKVSSWADMQQKITKWSFIFIAIFIPALIISVVVIERHFKSEITDIQTSNKTETPTWTDVDWRTRRGEVDQAIKVGEELIQKTPDYPDGHHRLAIAYLAAGKTQKARDHFAEAFRLFPSEENEKLLVAIDKRLKASAPDSGR